MKKPRQHKSMHSVNFLGNASVGLAIIGGAIFLILLGVFFWKKGDPKEPFWEALLNVIGDLLVWELPIFFTYRAWAVFSWFIGFGILIIATVVIVMRNIT